MLLITNNRNRLVNAKSGSEAGKKYLQNGQRKGTDKNCAKFELFFGFTGERIKMNLAFYRKKISSISSQFDAARLLGMKGSS